jgi:hypothetical protein
MTRSLSSVSTVIAVTATGVFWSGVSRFVAVTETASRFWIFFSGDPGFLDGVLCAVASWSAAYSVPGAITSDMATYNNLRCRFI